MAQGSVKKSKSAVAARKPSKTGPRPGTRIIKPKKATLITQNKIKHKSSCGLVTQTEKLLAQKAGHLEILKGGKGDKKGKGGQDGGQGHGGHVKPKAKAA